MVRNFGGGGTGSTGGGASVIRVTVTVSVLALGGTGGTRATLTSLGLGGGMLDFGGGVRRSLLRVGSGIARRGGLVGGEARGTGGGTVSAGVTAGASAATGAGFADDSGFACGDPASGTFNSGSFRFAISPRLSPERNRGAGQIVLPRAVLPCTWLLRRIP